MELGVSVKHWQVCVEGGGYFLYNCHKSLQYHTYPYAERVGQQVRWMVGGESGGIWSQAREGVAADMHTKGILAGRQRRMEGTLRE